MSSTLQFAKKQTVQYIHCVEDGCKIKAIKQKGVKTFDSVAVGNNDKQYDLSGKIVARSFLSSRQWVLRIEGIEDCLFYFSLETKVKFYVPSV